LGSIHEKIRGKKSYATVPLIFLGARQKFTSSEFSGDIKGKPQFTFLLVIPSFTYFFNLLILFFPVSEKDLVLQKGIYISVKTATVL
jgi:hypothetical protein